MPHTERRLEFSKENVPAAALIFNRLKYIIFPSFFSLAGDFSVLHPLLKNSDPLLVMIGLIADDGKCAIELFGKNSPHNLMGKGHFR